MDGPECIAIVGVGCKFPGANNLEEFWKVLEQGEDHVQDIPKERFNLDAFYDANPDAAGKLYMKKAGLVKGFEEWDNHFYGIGDNEARQTDPQQRFVLDCVHMAMEDGGITKQDVYGTDTGVYIGMMNDDYKIALIGQDELIDNYTVTGTNSGIISARVSYLYNLLGPSLVLDTACSSALVAIHLAASTIKSGEISMAICGGVNCIFNPETFISLSKARMASPTGKCQTFSKYADGYARGEGCGIVILKKLGKALEDGNKIWGIIATGCNQDGRTTSPITAPSSSQQVKLLEKVFEENNVCPSSVQYIEAHGTGTSIGDPIETNALGSFFSKHNRKEETKILIGSVKTNIGHLESAAGVAGLIKILLMMKHGCIVPSLHSKELNPQIQFDKFNLCVPQCTTTWPLNINREKTACINSFGFGGTNSHAIIKEIRRQYSKQMISKGQKPQIIVLSANDSVSFKDTIERYIESVSSTQFTVESLAYTSTVRRDHHRFRTFIVANSLLKVIESKIAAIQIPKPVPLHPPSVTFVFCGVGTSWQGMGKDLLERFPVFESTVRKIDSLILPLTGWSIFEIFSEGKPVTVNPVVNHIAIFTCQIALVHLWRSFGVLPASVIGQSVGEVAAAYTSGALNLEQAVTVIFHRSRILAEATGGEMAVVGGAKIEEVELQCKSLKCGVANIAVYISTESCTVSGEKKALEELKRSLTKKQKIRWTDLDVQCAYHSHFTKEPGMKLAQELKTLQPSPNTIPVFSTITGKVIISDQYCSSSYWASNVMEGVKFYQAVVESRRWHRNRDEIYLEVGPSPILRPHVASVFQDDNVEVIPSLTKKSGIQQILMAMGKLYVLGLNINWKALYEDQPPLADIPKYCFNCKPLFEESAVRKMKRNANINMTSQGVLMEKRSNDKFSVILSEQTTSYLFEHRVEESVIVPGAFYGAIGKEVGKTVWGLQHNTEVRWTIENPLAITPKQSSEIEVEYERKENTIAYRVFDVKQQLLSSGIVSKVSYQSIPDKLDIDDLKECINRKPKDDFIYKTLRRFGFNHGPLYRTIQKGNYNEDVCFVEVKLSESNLALFDGADIHPIVIDSMLQSCCAFLPFFHLPPNAKLFPVGVGKLSNKQKCTAKMYIYTKIMEKNISNFFCNSILLQENGIVVAEMLNIEFSILSTSLAGDDLSLRYEWNKMILNSKKLNDTGNITVLFSKNSLDVSFRERNYETIYIDGTNFEIAKEAILSKPRKLLVYIPGCIYEETGIQETYNKIVNDGKIFLKLVQSFSHLQMKVAVLTEATQNLNTRQQTVNLLGSELWGMVRSIAREPTKLSFHLIDTYPNAQQNIETVDSLLKQISKDDTEIPFETCVVNGEIHYGFIQQMFQKHSLHHSSEQQIFHRKRNSCLRNVAPFPTIEQESAVDVTVSFACQNVMDAFKSPISIVSAKVGDMWTSDGQNQFGMNVVEFSGVSSDENRRKREVVCCYPCPLVSEISLPKQFLLFKEDIPNYSPGMFQSCILATTIAEYLKNTKRVVAVADENFQGTTLLLKQILLGKDISLAFMSDLENVDPSKFGKTCLLLLTSSKGMKLNMFKIDSFSEVMFFDNDLKYIVKDKGIFVSPNEIFSLQNISKKMNDAKTLLNKLNGHSVFMRACDVTHQDLKAENVISQSYQSQSSILVKERSSYIVVGGLTGLGWLLVKELARCGAVKIIVFSRRLPNEEMKKKIKGLSEFYDVQVVPKQVDICNLRHLLQIFTDLKSCCKNEPIRGIFHGAAVTADKVAIEMSLEQYEVPLRPKILGTLNLDHVSRDLKLDYFVIHSSVAALLGNIGQCNYAAGNSFQDCFALFRRSRGLPATSIQWGALDVGLASDAITKESLRSQGLMSLTQQQILECTKRAVHSGDVHRIFTHTNWKVFLQDNIKSMKVKFKEFWNDSLVAVSANLPKKEKASTVDDNFALQMVIDCLASVFTLDPSQISLSTPVLDYGLDSQKGTELASLIFERSNVRVPYIFLATDDHSAFDIAQLVKCRQEIGVSNENSNENLKPEKSLNSFLEDLILTDAEIVYNVVQLVVTDTAIDPCMIKKSLRLLLLSHPEFRTVFRILKDSEGKKTLRKEIKENEESILNIEIVKEESMNESNKAQDVDYEAIKIKIVRRKTDIGIILMLNPLMFDACSIIGITEEIKKLVLHTRFKLSNQLALSGTENESQKPTFEDFFALEEEKMISFWKSELLKQKDKLLFQSNETSEEVRWSSIRVPDHVVSTLQKSLTRNDISMYQSMVCFVQLGLGIVTKASEVTILAQTDMRSLIGLEELAIGMYSNMIPLFSHVRKHGNMTLQDFILSNVRKFVSIQGHGKFPFHKIKDLPEFEESKHQSLACMFIDETKCNGYRKTVKVQGYRPGFTSLASVELTIVSSSQHLTLYINSHDSLYREAVALLECIDHLLKLYIHHENTKLQEILTVEPRMKDFGRTKNGNLFIETTGTSRKVVELKIHNTDGNGQCLQLGDTNLPLCDILPVCFNGKDHPKLVIQTKREVVTLYADDAKTCEVWATFINSKLGHMTTWRNRGLQSCLLQNVSGEMN